MSNHISTVERIAYPVKDFLSSFGMSRTKFYELIRSGAIKTFTVGKSRYVSAEAAREFIASCQSPSPGGLPS
jgi:hypothetical protein